MLDAQGNRQLVYVVKVDGIEPIPGYDRVEHAVVGGWRVIVQKGQFHVGDPAIYFEIDSRVPSDKECFSFLAKRDYKIKTLKMCRTISQGLLMHAQDFGWRANLAEGIIYDDKGIGHDSVGESRFLTKQLGVTYADDEDNQRKVIPVDKYKKMASRHPKIFSKPIVRRLMKTSLGRNILYLIFGNRKNKKNEWPSHIAKKTDVERIQNCIWLLQDKHPFVATEKIDGSSFSAMAERKPFGKIQYYVCSRNVVFNEPEAKCFYDTNIYYEAWQKYNLKDIITRILHDYHLPNIAIQAEIYGDKVQSRDYSMGTNERKMAVFHIVSNGVKFPMEKTAEICEKYGLPHVPILDANYIFPDTIEELQEYVESEGSKVDGLPREGIVFYDKATGQQYVKFVSPNFLMKYHGG